MNEEFLKWMDWLSPVQADSYPGWDMLDVTAEREKEKKKKNKNTKDREK